MLKVRIKKQLNGFSLKVKLETSEEILSILGPSGSGKTLTLQSIAGLIQPDSGHIELNGRILFSTKEKINLAPQIRNIGFVFQDYALFPHLTVAENVAYGMKGLERNAVLERTDLFLTKMNIEGLRNRYPHEISSGQQQRVALARAVATEPEALLLDEPFSALDTYRRERLEYELLHLKSYYNGDILFVTHDLHQGYKLGERLAIFDHGSIIQLDYKKKVISSPKNQTVARLTGVKNLFHGKVLSQNRDNLYIFVPEFSATFRVCRKNTPSCINEQTVTIGIRPEHIKLTGIKGENTIHCRLENVVDGVTNLHYYYFAISDQEQKYKLECYLSDPLKRETERPEGTQCIQFPPDKIIMLSDPYDKYNEA